MMSVRVEVFSDYTCPWCYVGWARFEKAMRQLPDGVVADVQWRPFEIHPEVPMEGMPFEDLGYPADRWASMQEALRASAAAEGLIVENRPKVSNTHRALMAGAWAQADLPDLFPAFHERIFVGYFDEGRDLGDVQVIDSLAASVGIQVNQMHAALDQGGWEAALYDTAADARKMGITGTPTFVFNRSFAIYGAQPVHAFLRAFENAKEVQSDDSAQDRTVHS